MQPPRLPLQGERISRIVWLDVDESELLYHALGLVAPENIDPFDPLPISPPEPGDDR